MKKVPLGLRVASKLRKKRRIPFAGKPESEEARARLYNKLNKNTGKSRDVQQKMDDTFVKTYNKTGMIDTSTVKAIFAGAKRFGQRQKTARKLIDERAKRGKKNV
jgi:hypothetical protein